MDEAINIVGETLASRPVLVLGSSPNLNLPSDFSDEWALICINASGNAAKANDLKNPDLTVFAISTMLKSDPKFVEIRENVGHLKGRYVFMRTLGGGPIKRRVRTYQARKVLASLGYEFESVFGLHSKTWRAVVRKVMGEENERLAKNISTGVFCVILAIHAGANKVVTAGIDPYSTGHSYSSSNIFREHQNADIRTIEFLKERYQIEVL